MAKHAITHEQAAEILAQQRMVLAHQKLVLQLAHEKAQRKVTRREQNRRKPSRHELNEHCFRLCEPRDGIWAVMPWRSGLALMITVILLGALVTAEFYRYAWVLVWLVVYAWSVHETIVIAIDLFDHRAHMRQHLKGLKGMLRCLDVWLLREFALAALMYFYFLFGGPASYGTYILGLQEFDNVPFAQAVFPAYSALSAFSVSITTTGAISEYFAVQSWLRLFLSVSALARVVNAVIVIVLGLSKSNDDEFEEYPIVVPPRSLESAELGGDDASPPAEPLDSSKLY
jgi:hypothetical protein